MARSDGGRQRSRGKTLFITGASRGIGLAIALRAARDGANVAIAAKTTEPHPEAARHDLHRGEGDRSGGRQGAAACGRHPRRGAGRRRGGAKTVETFGGIDILVNNASAISLTGTLDTPMKRYDLMHQINTRGTFLVLAGVHPAPQERGEPARPQPLAAAQHGGALVRAARRLHDGEVRHEHVRARHGGRVRADGIAVNALWPRTIIATAAVQAIPRRRRGADAHAQARDHGRRRARDPHRATRASITGHFFIDDDVLRSAGVTDLSQYRHAGVTDADLLPDLFL